jgi:hypothetical protein
MAGQKLAQKGLQSLVKQLQGGPEDRRAVDAQRAGERMEIMPSMPPDVQAALAGTTPGVGGSGFSQANIPTDQFSLANLGPFGESAQSATTVDPSQIFGEGMSTPSSFQAGTAATPLAQAFEKSGVSRDLVGGGLSSLQGLLSLYGGSQSGDVKQLLGGSAGLLSGLSKLAPETTSALSSSLGLGSGGLGLAAGGLGGVAGGFGLYQGIDQGDPMQALMGAAGLYGGVAPIVNALGGVAGTQLPTLTSALSALAAKLGVTGGTTAAGAAAPAATGAAAGSAAALGPIAMAAGPYIVGKLFEMGVEMTEGKEQAARTGKQFSKLMGDLPHQAKSIMGTAPDLLSKLDTANPEEAARIFDQLQGIQGQFGGSGMENFLRQGETGSQYGDFAKGVSAKFPESQNVYKALQPGLGALSLGRIRAQDIAQRGGVNIPGAFTPQAAALNLGQELYSSSEAGSPGAWSVKPANEWLAQNYRDPWAGRTQYDIEAGQHAGTVPWEYKLGDKSWSPEAEQAFQGFQPGGMESGLSELFGGQFSPAVMPWMQSAAPQTPAGPAPRPFAGPAAGVAPLGSSGFASLKGPTSELLTAEDPNRL